MASFGGLNFGAGTNTALPAVSTGFSFGTNPAQNTAGGGGFQLGATTTQTTTPATGFGGLNFGTTTTAVNPLLAGSTSTAAPANPLFGVAPAPGATGGCFSFASGNKPTLGVAPTATSTSTGGLFTGATNTGFSLGGTSVPVAAAATSAAVPSLFGTGLGVAATTIVATTAASATTPFNFASTSVSSNIAAIAPSVSLGLGGSSAPTLGLGGAQPPAAAAGEASGSKTEGKPTKETPLPQDIFATIAAFENFKSVEKAASEANLRQSAAAFHKLGDDCKKLRSHVTQLATLHAALQHKVNALKEKIVRDSDDVEMSRRTHNTPLHLQGDNTAPEQYFIKAVQSFEAHMLACRERIEEVEKCLAVVGQPQNNEAAMIDLVRRQHDDLQVAASHVYKLHAKLIQLNKHLPCPEHLKPKPMFRPGVGDMSRLENDDTKSAVPKESSVIRSCFDLPGGASRLGTFQMNMARARALSLNPAPPPTQPLQQTQPLFGGNTTLNTSSGFGLGNNPTFGSPATGTTNFGTGTNFGGLATNQNTSFGAGASAFGNSTLGTYNFNSPNSTTTQAGSIFSSTFGQSNKLFKT